ncbi:hypothetical protein BABINDRAFT_159508 [Babjeviella inositovora NRRL Y-12698]|uniref:Phospholipid-transporting ATPase n=1 Tax=Babjeviella inositovora NRRL Y-12698 TaxID=984486 RepID=A0A1E3QZK0_9ASCO|nr:uncharacterized protein BABINDRAFT_159508 [Babjeviella inositovora NRRL Y-12698]ODQ83041.1 hypothetical protein BABINDRAFT_159508 [Babjeviella inositovora NRRL Y-12698]
MSLQEFSEKPELPQRKFTFKQKCHNFAYNHNFAGVGPPQHIIDEENAKPRRIFLNLPLPDDMVVDQTSKTPLRTYPRNKIRTTKYTPLNFLPKNLFFQFRNVANSYFLFLIILGPIQIFGVSSPGLAAVPLVVIVCLTAIKDAFEDYRRVISDMELNNSPIHILVGLDNPNYQETKVGAWRRFKKRCSNAIMKKLMAKGKPAKGSPPKTGSSEHVPDVRRTSVASDNIVRTSLDSRTTRKVSPVHPHTVVSPVSDPLEATTRSSLFKRRNWKDIHVGNIIRINNNEEVPADVVIFATSGEEGNCFIETKNLDGETNLKSRMALHCGEGLHYSTDFARAQCWLECEGPNPNLYAFKGVLNYLDYYSEKNQLMETPVPASEVVTNDNVLLRGCTLRNTKWALGMVVYTGPESKIMLNSGITPTKKSRIANELNLSVIFNFAVLFVMCFVTGVVNGLFYNKKRTSRLFFEYKPYSPTSAGNGTLAFFVALIIYQALVPISLYISIEIVKTLQAYFIYSDVKMYYEKLDFPCTPKAWNISDDLGQIEYVFCDKTGTLTQNVMEFKKCSINGKSYGLAYTEARQGMEKREGKDVVAESLKWNKRIAADRADMIDLLKSHSKNSQLVDDEVTFVSSEYAVDISASTPSPRQKQANEEFMTALALCHTVVTEDDPEYLDHKLFKAESPDEAALVSVARDVGIVFSGRTRKSLTLHVYGKEQTFTLLAAIPFSSARKRMSSVVEDASGRIFLICKGADSVIFEKLAGSTIDQDMLSRTALHLEDYAKEGLRTLCIAQRLVSRKEYQDWKLKYDKAINSIDSDRDVNIELVCDEIEKDLTLLGGTAIEDRLQDGVPDSIAILGQAGIKLWVLTGDRIETAINIGFSCNLLENDMKLLVIRPDENITDGATHIDSLLTLYLQDNFQMTGSQEELTLAREDHSPARGSFAVIVDGAALSIIFSGDEFLRRKFLLLGKQCKAVLCCRVSPAQKALVVKLVKDSLQVMTLAIGDGANDVAMIQAANVGVGIAGEEGRQAVMSSDYAIGQFRFLTRLMLVHGRWSYKRLAEMIPCFFYKNTVFTVTLFWYGIFNNFDGSYLFEYTFLMLYNLAFTSLPVIFLAVLDQDVSDTVSLLVPQLYRSGILRKDWSQYKFFWYMLDGLYQSAIAFFLPFCLYRIGFNGMNGLPQDHRFFIGITVTNIAVVSSNVYVLMRQYRWDWLTLCINAFSILIVFFWTGVWSTNVSGGEFYNSAPRVFGSLSTWCTFFVGILACMLPRFSIDCIKGLYFPKDAETIRVKVNEGYFSAYPDGYDPTDFHDVEAHRQQIGVNQKTDDSYSHESSVYQDPVLAKNANGTGDPEAAPLPAGAPTREPSVLKRTFKSIRRIGRKSSGAGEKKLTPLDQMRLNMIRDGEYLSSRTSLERVTTTHDLPGFSQAESLMRLQTRNTLSSNAKAQITPQL